MGDLDQANQSHYTGTDAMTVRPELTVEVRRHLVIRVRWVIGARKGPHHARLVHQGTSTMRPACECAPCDDIIFKDHSIDSPRSFPSLQGMAVTTVRRGPVPVATRQLRAPNAL